MDYTQTLGRRQTHVWRQLYRSCERGGGTDRRARESSDSDKEETGVIFFIYASGDICSSVCQCRYMSSAAPKSRVVRLTCDVIPRNWSDDVKFHCMFFTRLVADDELPCNTVRCLTVTSRVRDVHCEKNWGVCGGGVNLIVGQGEKLWVRQAKSGWTKFRKAAKNLRVWKKILRFQCSFMWNMLKNRESLVDVSICLTPPSPKMPPLARVAREDRPISAPFHTPLK